MIDDDDDDDDEGNDEDVDDEEDEDLEAPPSPLASSPGSPTAGILQKSRPTTLNLFSTVTQVCIALCLLVPLCPPPWSRPPLSWRAGSFSKCCQ